MAAQRSARFRSQQLAASRRAPPHHRFRPRHDARGRRLSRPGSARSLRTLCRRRNHPCKNLASACARPVRPLDSWPSFSSTRQFDDRHRRPAQQANGFTDAASSGTAHRAHSRCCASRNFAASPLTGNFDIQHLRRIHQYIFQDVFPWAGDFREVTTSRTNSFGFPPPQFLIPSLETLFAALKTENHLNGLTPDALRRPRRPLPRRAQRHPPLPRRQRPHPARVHPHPRPHRRPQTLLAQPHPRREQRSLPHQLRHRQHTGLAAIIRKRLT